MRPRVGISMDIGERPIRGAETAYDEIQRYYIDAVVKAGGLPLLLPALPPALVAEYIENIDAIVLPGGASDVDPILYRAKPHAKLGKVLPTRTAFELALLSAAGKRPVLGLCGGMQLMNVARGGTLWQDIASEKPGALDHEKPGDKRDVSHDVKLTGYLAKIFAAEHLGVNSTHHQAIAEVGKNLVVEAIADDGIIEGIVDPSLPFFVGLEWHPEAMHDAPHQRIYDAFVAAAR